MYIAIKAGVIRGLFIYLPAAPDPAVDPVPVPPRADAYPTAGGPPIIRRPVKVWAGRISIRIAPAPTIPDA
jgi:hypothetical protein